MGGSYLSKPVTDKVSVDELNDKLSYGASSMQGWRVSQEDAHNAILDFDENTSFFAVYDGHGGQEVAQYCSQKLPQFIKDTGAYKKGDIEQALVEGFLGFDASVATPEVVEVLKELAGDKQAEESDGEENYNHLYEEASMPIEKVIEKYTNLVNPTLKSLKKGDKIPRSPVIASKESCSTSCAASSSGEADSNSLDAQEGCSSSSMNDLNVSEAGCSSSSSSKSEPDSSSSSEVNGGSKNEADGKCEDSMPTSNGSIPEIRVTSPTEKKEVNNSDNEVSESVPESREVIQNGDVGGSADEVKDEKKDAVSSSVDSEVVSIKGKGKSPMKKSPKTPVVNERPKRNATQLYKKLFLPESEEEDTEDEEDKTFMEPEGSSEEEEADGSEDSSDADDEDEDEEEEGEGGEDEEDDDDETELEFARNMKEEPGSDSGCTAVVAVLKGRELYVANAGDSRCVVSRKGFAIEMSLDHKPEDEPERARIVKAGGKVTVDGRVNGGLNLSRAIGDHAYKQNKELNDKEQMITALPDIKKLTINPDEDEFMVLACDGIWNYMSSQEVVNFVKPRIENSADKISHICEEMFDHCLAPNTNGDGTGCDNMTAIVVKFNSNMKKRSMSPEPSNCDDEAEAKRPKTEEPQSVDTSSSSS